MRKHCPINDALPNASFIDITGTPFEQNDANTREVFGGYISVDDIRRAVVAATCMKKIIRLTKLNAARRQLA